jgi:hypothetical protein
MPQHGGAQPCIGLTGGAALASSLTSEGLIDQTAARCKIVTPFCVGWLRHRLAGLACWNVRLLRSGSRWP